MMALSMVMTYIIIDIALICGILFYWFWNNFLDTRARVHFIFPDKQLRIFKVKLNKDTLSYVDGKIRQTYTVNRDLIYFRRRQPFVFYFFGNPVPINLLELLKIEKLTPNEKKVLNSLDKRFNLQLELKEPSRWLNQAKTVAIDSAETLFRILYTNLTLNLIKSPTDLKKTIKWTLILIVGAVGMAIVLHLVGVINIYDILGTKPPSAK